MSTIRVVMADDQPIVRRGIALLLQRETGIEVIAETSDGSETVDAVKRLRPDVVLMDIDMPGMSGLDATRRINEMYPSLPVLILTIYDREDLLYQALQSGAPGYMLKTADVDELMAAIRTVHSGEVFICPRMATMLVGKYLNNMRPGQGEDSYEKLSTREREVLPLLAESHTNHEIAASLHLSPYTVQTYRQRIMRKLDLHSRSDLLKYALRRKIISLDP